MRRVKESFNENEEDVKEIQKKVNELKIVHFMNASRQLNDITIDYQLHADHE